MGDTGAPRKRRRALLLATFDIACCTLLACLLSFSLTQPAWAYVDPSVMTYTIQAIAGVAVALSAVAGVAMRRTRKKLLRALNVDENARKDVEADVHRVDPETRKAVGLPAKGEKREDRRSGSAVRNQAGRGESGFTPTWAQRAALSLAVSTFAVLTLLVVAPYETVVGSAGSIFFTLNDVWAPIALVAAGIAFALTAVLTMLRGRVFNAALLVLFAFGLGCYVQALFLNGGLPTADGGTVSWNELRKPMLVSTLVWAALVAIPLQLSKRNRKATQMGACALSLALVIVQGVGIASLASKANETASPQGEAVVTEQGLHTVSSKSNVVVFVLDTYDTQMLLDTFQTSTDMLDDFTGFTWYQDSLGSMIPTRYGLSFLLHGQYPKAEESMGTYLAERYKRSPFLADIQNLGYSTGVYTDSISTQFLTREEADEYVNDRTVNVHPVDHTVTNWPGTLKALFKCALFRDLPWLAKPYFWFYSDEITQATHVEGEELAPGNTPYIMDDARYFAALKDTRLSFQEDDDQRAGAFRFIHMTGTHPPYNLDENGNNVGMGNSTLVRQGRGSMRIVQEYLNQLKELGVYDKTTVIITADHGDWYMTETPLEKPTTPYMLVKPAQSADLDARPYQVSHAPIAAEDVLPTCIKYMGGDYSGYDGFAVDEVPAGLDRTRHFNMTLVRSGRDYRVIEYSVKGDSLDFTNWKLTGVSWDVG
ncbi:hypothetical protein JI75_00440 [Berryella intestinalis]|uniref:Sulfatase N-terminal domain-containing protein n=1 Tax=Berryella intestinalis TaxID=1531429 RepID=A0A0A8B8D9_9ACTN|nr:sulfatase-like hydrolase/transferase [Berryella intestinalis]AJC11397.1 hypothetical protein JI75_00440 [Berryella intestinalis]